MSANANIRRRHAAATTSSQTDLSVSSLLFFIYLLYLVVFLLSMPNRISAIGAIRPTVTLALLTWVFLLLEWRNTPSDETAASRRLLFFIGYIFLSLPFVEWPGSVIRENLQNFLKVAFFFVFTVKIIDSEKRLKIFVIVFLVCQSIRVLEPLYLHYTEGYWGDMTHVGGGDFMMRLSGAPTDRMINSNGLAFIIISVLPFLYFLMLGSDKKWVKLAFFAVVPFMIHALILTGSRSGMIGFVVAVFVIIAIGRKLLLALTVVPVLLILSFPYMPEQFQDRYLSIFGMSETHRSTFEGRIAGWKHDFDTFVERPIVGHGMGTSLEASYHRTGSALVSHNMYTETLIETGIIGAALFLWFLSSILKNALDVARGISAAGSDVRARLEFSSRLNRALITWGAVCLVFSMAQYGLSEYHWYILGGLVVVNYRLVHQKIGIDTAESA